MSESDVDAAIESVQEELAAKGMKMEGLSAEGLRDAMSHPKAREVISKLMQREASSVQVGDPAPDFCLPRLEPERRGESARLSDHFGARPVALIFGSYT